VNYINSGSTVFKEELPNKVLQPTPKSGAAELGRCVDNSADVRRSVKKMNSDVVYSDKLVTISDDEIIFHNYYFPAGKDKVVAFDNIKAVSVLKPSLLNGKWRIHGTGNLKIWFPKDTGRPERDRIFIALLKSQWVNIGFTVEDGARVESILRSRNLLQKE